MKVLSVTKSTLVALIVCTSDVFAYPQQTLHGDVYADVKILKTSVVKNSYRRITNSPGMINRLRTIFSSNNIKKSINQKR